MYSLLGVICICLSRCMKLCPTLDSQKDLTKMRRSKLLSLKEETAIVATVVTTHIKKHYKWRGCVAKLSSYLIFSKSSLSFNFKATVQCQGHAKHPFIQLKTIKIIMTSEERKKQTSPTIYEQIFSCLLNSADSSSSESLFICKKRQQITLM